MLPEGNILRRDLFSGDSDGLGLGIIAYTILNCRTKGRGNWLLWLISLLFVVKYIFL